MTKVIALCGGPGVGKSTVATGLFSAMKQRKVSCEYVSEYAKDITWEGTHTLLENQIHVFSEQFRRQFRLLNKVDYIVTDCPLIFNSIYFDFYLKSLKEPVFSKEYTDLARRFFDLSFKQFDTKTYLLKRFKEYDPNGRNQTLEEAKGIDRLAEQKLLEVGADFTVLYGFEEENIAYILRDLGLDHTSNTLADLAFNDYVSAINKWNKE